MEDFLAFAGVVAVIVVMPGPDMALVLPGTIFICMGLIWLTSDALLVAKVAAVLKRSVVRRALNAITGAASTALGVRLGFERR